MKGSRDWSSGRAAAVASTPGSRAQALTDGGFLGLRHKTKLGTAVEEAKSWRQGVGLGTGGGTGVDDV